MSNTISVNVVADVRNAARSIDSIDTKLGGLGKSVGKAGGVMKSAFTGVAAFAAGNAIVGQIKGIVTGASDLNETVSKTQSIFGKSSPAIIAWGDGAAKSMGLSKQAALDGASTFGNFFNQIGIGSKQTEAMSKNFVKAAVDLGSFHNAAPTEVMEALSAATRGEYDSLQKFIPTINAAAVEQKALTMTHKASAKELTNQDKALAVHQIVMQGMGKANGDFAKTQGSLANQTKIAKAEFDNMKTTLGTALLPMFTTLAHWIVSEGIPALKQFGDFFKTNILPTLQTVGTILQTIVLPAFMTFGGFFVTHLPVIGAFAAAIGALMVVQKVHAAFMAVQAVGGLVAYIAQMNIVQAVTRTWTAVQWLLNSAFLANPITLVIVAIVALVAAIVIAWKNSQTFRNIVIGAWNAIKTATSSVFGWMKTFISGAFSLFMTLIKNFTLPGLIISHWNQIKAVTSAAWGAVKTTVSGAFSAIKGYVTSGLSAISTSWTSAWNAVKSFIGTVWGGIKTGVSTGISNVMTLVSGIKDKVTGALSGAGSWLVDVGRNIIEGLISGVQSVTGRIADAVLNPIKDSVNAVKNFLGIHSPSRLFKEIGQYVNEGLAVGLQKTQGVKKAATGLAGAVSDGFTAPKLSMNASFAGGAGAGGNAAAPTIIINAGVGDPVAIGREVDKVLHAYYSMGARRSF